MKTNDRRVQPGAQSGRLYQSRRPDMTERLEPISKNIYEKVSSSLPLDSMFVTSTPGLRVTSRVNDVTRARSCVRLARQHGCRTPNDATRGWGASKATNPARDGTGDGYSSATVQLFM